MALPESLTLEVATPLGLVLKTEAQSVAAPRPTSRRCISCTGSPSARQRSHMLTSDKRDGTACCSTPLPRPPAASGPVADSILGRVAC